MLWRFLHVRLLYTSGSAKVLSTPLKWIFSAKLSMMCHSASESVAIYSINKESCIKDSLLIRIYLHKLLFETLKKVNN